MWELLAVLYALVSFFSLWREFHALLVVERFSVSSFCRVWFVSIQFCLPCILLMRYLLFGIRAESSYAAINYDDSTLPVAYIVLLFSIVAYLVLAASTRPRRICGEASDSPHLVPCEHFRVSRVRVAAFLCLAVGAICLFLWSSAYGSIFGLIEVGNSVRSGWSVVHNPFAMFKHPSRLVLVASYIYFALLYSKRGKLISSDTLFFAISVYLSFLFLLANDGRLSMAFYFLGFFLVSLYMRVFIRRKPFDLRAGVAVLVVCLFLVGVMLNMDSITYYIRHGEFPTTGTDGGSSFLDELLFDPASDMTVVNNLLDGKLDLMAVHDFLYGIFAWLPQSLTPSWVLRLWSVNTSAVNPVFTTGEIPCGLLAQGVYDLGLIGVVALPFLYGRLLRFTDERIVPLIVNPFIMGLFAYLFTDLLRVVSYAMLYDFVLDLFPIAIAACLYALSGLITKDFKTERAQLDGVGGD